MLFIDSSNYNNSSEEVSDDSDKDIDVTEMFIYQVSLFSQNTKLQPHMGQRSATDGFGPDQELKVQQTDFV